MIFIEISNFNLYITHFLFFSIQIIYYNMSGNVEKVVPSLIVKSICPIVINATEQVLTYRTASSVAVPNPVRNGLEICFPNDYVYLQVWTEAQAPKCCDYGVQKAIQTNSSIYG
jgi:hypothetical protein